MTTPTIESLNQQIAQLELERMQLPVSDPAAIEQSIQQHASRAIPGLPGAAEALAGLQALIASKDAALQHQARRVAIDNELRHLNITRDAEVADEERYRLEDARKEFDSACAEFVAASKQMCRLYQRMHQIDLRNASRLPRYQQHVMPAFNIAIPLFSPYGWNGVTSQYVVDGSLPWLKDTQ